MTVAGVREDAVAHSAWHRHGAWHRPHSAALTFFKKSRSLCKIANSTVVLPRQIEVRKHTPAQRGPVRAQTKENAMGRQLRYFEPRTVVKVTTDTAQNRNLLRPSKELKEAFIGVGHGRNGAVWSCRPDPAVHRIIGEGRLDLCRAVSSFASKPSRLAVGRHLVQAGEVSTREVRPRRYPERCRSALEGRRRWRRLVFPRPLRPLRPLRPSRSVRAYFHLHRIIVESEGLTSPLQSRHALLDPENQPHRIRGTESTEIRKKFILIADDIEMALSPVDLHSAFTRPRVHESILLK